MKNLVPRFILDKYSKNLLSGKFKAYTMFIDISGFTPMTQDLMSHGNIWYAKFLLCFKNY